MNKLGNKVIVSVTGVALLASGACFSSGAQAAGSGSITAVNVSTISESSVGSVGTIKVTLPAGIRVEDGDKVVVQLPKNVTLTMDENGFVRDPMDEDGKNQLIIPELTSGNANPLSTLNGGDPGIEMLSATEDEIHIGIKLDSTSESIMLDHDGVFFLRFGDVTWNHLSEGPVEVSLEASTNSAFPAGNVTVAHVKRGYLEVKAKSSTSDHDFKTKLTLVESVPGAFEIGEKSLEIELPSGYQWTGSDAVRDIPASSYGQDISIRVTPNDRKLIIDFLGTLNTDGEDDEVTPRATTEASKWEIPNLTFSVKHTQSVKPGPIMASLKGKTDVEETEMRVGVYGETGVNVTAEEPTTIIAGRDEQKIADLTFKETLARSLPVGRTIKLTLPEGARFQPAYEGEETHPAGDTEDNNKGLQLTFKGYNGPDERTATFEVTGQTSGKVGVYSLKDMEVATAADFSGDLEVEIGGSAGVTGKFKVAEAQSPISATVSEVAEIGIGLTNQETGNLSIEESVAGSLLEDGTVSLELPEGITFDGTPTVNVTEGDVGISNVKLANDDRSLLFEIVYESTIPSVIHVSDIHLASDRTTPEGDVVLKINGSAMFETKNYYDWKDIDAVSKLTLAKVATPAPKEMKQTATFSIGKHEYEINGIKQIADVAPYIREGRTYLPVRFVAEALGLQENNIIWNDQTKTVTLIKGERVVQLQIGNPKIQINGSEVGIDASAEIKDGRTTLPIRAIAQAFGANIEWDAATSTVTID